MSRVKDQYFDEIARNSAQAQYARDARLMMAELYDNFQSPKAAAVTAINENKEGQNNDSSKTTNSQ